MSKKDIQVIDNDVDYAELIDKVGATLQKGKNSAAAAVNSVMVQTYWEIGQQIVEYEQGGHAKAEYGADVLNRLSRDLTERYGKGFSRSNVFYMRKMYSTYPRSEQISDILSWSHYIELLKLNDELERAFYEKECVSEHWGVRELKRQMKSMLFHRIALSSDKNEVLRLAREGQVIEKPEDILRDPYVFEFTGLPQVPVYNEGDLEEALVNNLSQFFLELGKGFTYVGRQQKLVIAGRIYKVDLVFYHRILKCFVLVDLKQGEVQHEDIGQMNFYLNYFREEMNTEGDTEPIGIVLGAYQDKLVMQYALQNITNQVFVSRYQLYLPEREQLEAEFRRIMDTTEFEQEEDKNSDGV
jgi:predicted nuclease of restriction endonuclease-like (RecB) superfamily